MFLHLRNLFLWAFKLTSKLRQTSLSGKGCQGLANPQTNMTNVKVCGRGLSANDRVFKHSS